MRSSNVHNLLLAAALLAALLITATVAQAACSGGGSGDVTCSDNLGCPRVGKRAPSFKTKALFPNGTIGQISSADILARGSWYTLLTFPLCHTFVCETELVELGLLADKFRENNAEVVAVSVDSIYSIQAWSVQPIAKGGLGGKASFPIGSDLSKKISRDFGVLADDGDDEGISLRGTFIIDSAGTLRSMTINHFPVGRNIHETLRLVKAFQHADASGKVCPSRWTQAGDKTITPNPTDKIEFFEKFAEEV